MVAAQYDIHPAAMLFPAMTEAEFAELKADIEQHGQGQDIVLIGGQVLDGRHRLRACEELGIEPAIAEFQDGDVDPIAYVLSHNLHRRHLNETARATIAAKVAKMRQGDRPPIGGTASSDVESPMTLEDAANALNVGKRSVERAATVLERGAPAVVAAIEHGELRLGAAEQLVKAVPDPMAQTSIIEKGPQAIRDAVASAKQESRKDADPPEPSRVKEFQSLWKSCDPIAQAAIRAQVLDTDAVDVRAFRECRRLLKVAMECCVREDVPDEEFEAMKRFLREHKG